MTKLKMEISDKLTSIKNSIPKDCVLVAVSKTKPIEDLQEAYSSSQLDFGENKVQELVHKYETLPKDIKWHMIGHLQRNKVKYIAPFVHLIHGVDTLKLLKEINKQGAKNNRSISCLIQMHIAKEETKFGFSEDELTDDFFDEVRNMPWIKVVGLMGMATNTGDSEIVKGEFDSLKNLFERIKSTRKIPNVDMKYLSMGMSNDYQLAIECGSNMIRVGSKIFGERNYKV